MWMMTSNMDSKMIMEITKYAHRFRAPPRIAYKVPSKNLKKIWSPKSSKTLSSITDMEGAAFKWQLGRTSQQTHKHLWSHWISITHNQHKVKSMTHGVSLWGNLTQLKFPNSQTVRGFKVKVKILVRFLLTRPRQMAYMESTFVSASSNTRPSFL